MSTISPQQAIAYARNAGFQGANLPIIVAIAMAESGLQTDIRGKQDPRDRGILQVNSYWHPEVSDQCAFDPQCAFNAAFKISSNGSNFSPWTTYTSGEYKQYLGSTPAGGVSSSGSASSSGVPFLDDLKRYGEYIAIFLIAAVLIIIGFVLLAEKQATQVAKKVIS